MIPLWMFPVATVCGNTMILKPSEKDPGATMLLAKLAKEAGLPDGVLQVRTVLYYTALYCAALYFTASLLVSYNQLPILYCSA